MIGSQVEKSDTLQNILGSPFNNMPALRQIVRVAAKVHLPFVRAARIAHQLMVAVDATHVVFRLHPHWAVQLFKRCKEWRLIQVQTGSGGLFLPRPRCRSRFAIRVVSSRVFAGKQLAPIFQQGLKLFLGQRPAQKAKVTRNLFRSKAESIQRDQGNLKIKGRQFVLANVENGIAKECASCLFVGSIAAFQNYPGNLLRFAVGWLDTNGNIAITLSQRRQPASNKIRHGPRKYHLVGPLVGVHESFFLLLLLPVCYALGKKLVCAGNIFAGYGNLPNRSICGLVQCCVLGNIFGVTRIAGQRRTGLLVHRDGNLAIALHLFLQIAVRSKHSFLNGRLNVQVEQLFVENWIARRKSCQEAASRVLPELVRQVFSGPRGCRRRLDWNLSGNGVSLRRTHLLLENEPVQFPRIQILPPFNHLWVGEQDFVKFAFPMVIGNVANTVAVFVFVLFVIRVHQSFIIDILGLLLDANGSIDNAFIGTFLLGLGPSSIGQEFILRFLQ
mmetsp:Transcript_3827/g.9673  ORF Transcript_3827/g.9673 Transcript_3827/m.9673 type:complete len:500 (+) Transcript_3827:886-2385(+)